MDDLGPLFTLLRRADAVHARVEAALAPFGLTRPTWEALRLLRCQGAKTQKALAAHAGCAPSNVTRLVDRLEKQGFVVRCADREDRRVITAQLTAAGTAALDGADAAVRAAQAELVERFGAPADAAWTGCDGT